MCSGSSHDGPTGAPDPGLDRVTRVGLELLGAQGCLVTRLDEQGHRAESAAGDRWSHLAGAASPPSDCFCQWVVAHEAPMVVSDAARDPRLAGLPPVAAGLRSYLGVPLRDADGVIRGALCVVGTEPRAWNDTDVRQLRDLAALAPLRVPGEPQRIAHVQPPEPTVPLTARERQVFELIVRGLPNRDIAAELGVSVDTVKSHVSQVLRKLQVPSRSAAVVEAMRLGIIS